MNKLVKQNKTKTLEAYLLPRLKKAKSIVNKHMKKERQLIKKWQDNIKRLKKVRTIDGEEAYELREAFENDVYSSMNTTYSKNIFLDKLWNVMIGKEYLKEDHHLFSEIVNGEERVVNYHNLIEMTKVECDSTFVEKHNQVSAPLYYSKYKYPMIKKSESLWNDYNNIDNITMQKDLDLDDEEKRIFPRILFMMLVEYINHCSFAMYSVQLQFPSYVDEQIEQLKLWRTGRYTSRANQVSNIGVGHWRPFGRKNKMDEKVFADLKSIMKVYNELEIDK